MLMVMEKTEKRTIHSNRLEPPNEYLVEFY